MDKYSRKNYYAPMGRHTRRLWPLSVCLREHLRPGSCWDEPAEQRAFPWQTLHGDWTAFCELMASDRGAGFSASLSPSQKSSYEILAAWWQSRYLPSQMVEIFQDLLEEWAHVPSTGFPQYPKHEDFIVQAGQARGASMYHLYCLRLLLNEFHPFNWEPYMSASSTRLETLRHHAVAYDLFQSLGHASLYAPQDTLVPTKYQPGLGTLRGSHPQNGARVRDTEPYFLWDVRQRQTVEVAKLDQLPGFVCISHTWGRWVIRTPDGLPVTVRMQDQVPWLVPLNTRYRVQDLPGQFAQLGVEYIWFDLFCIPQDSGNPDDDPVFAAPEGHPGENITGARLRTIEIGRQVDIFRGASNCIGWIHDVESWNGLSYALDWLGLKYLANTSLFEFPGIDIGIKIEQAVGSATSELPELVVPSRRASKASVVTQTGAGRKDGRYIPFGGEAYEPVSWFTSLWTLQEAALRPDMTLCSRRWHALQDRCGRPISLSALFLCLDRLDEHTYAAGPPSTKRAAPALNDEDWAHYFFRFQRTSYVGPARPRGVEFLQDFRWLVIMTEMLNEREFSVAVEPSADVVSADLLRIGNIRECSGARTPAVMSAVGAVEWYRKRVAEGRDGAAQEGDRLVLGVYELDFVREVATKLGSPFYASMIKFNTRLTASSSTGPRRTIGSMLPFSPHAAVLGTDEAIDTRIDHPSVKSWQILEDGAVHIRSAGILASSCPDTPQGPAVPTTRFMIFYGVEDENEPGVDHDAGIRTGHPSQDTFSEHSTEDFWNKAAGFRSTVNLRGALMDLSREGRDEVVAVTLFKGAAVGQMQHGVILQSPCIGSSGLSPEGSRNWIKIGIYRSYFNKSIGENLVLPSETGVDWVVW